MRMSSNRLKLSTDKTRFIRLGTKQQKGKVCCKTIILGGTVIPMATKVTCLGLVLDNELKFAARVKRLPGRCFYRLRQLRIFRRTIATDAAKTLVNALITSHVDYGDSVFVRVYVCCFRSNRLHIGEDEKRKMTTFIDFDNCRRNTPLQK